MDAMIKILLYVAIGFLLLTANIWYLKSIGSTIWPRTPRVIAPFQIVGKSDEGGKLGIVLASMLKARLGRIREEMEASARSLEDAKSIEVNQEIVPGVFRISKQPMEPIPLPNEVFQPLNLNMSVGGVEVGGILSWLQRRLTQDDALSFSAHYSGDKAIVSGSLDSAGSKTLWIGTSGSNDDELVADIAYAITQKRFSERYAEVEALTTKEFQSLLTILHNAAELNRQTVLGRTTGAGYDDLLTGIQKLLEKMPNWKLLVRLTAEIAERAERLETAIAFYYRELTLTSVDSAQEHARKFLEQKIGKIKELSNEKAAATAALESANTSPGLAGGSVVDKIRSLVGVSTLEMNRNPMIAIIGPPPPKGVISEDQISVLKKESDPRTAYDPSLQEYVSSLVQSSQLIAPKTRFIFIPININKESSAGSSGFVSELLVALNRLLAASIKPDILLVSYRGLDLEVIGKAFQTVATQGITIIVPAGNDPSQPVPFSKSYLLDQILVVSAVDLQGSKAGFSASDDKVVWAPGERIPFKSPLSGEVELWNGTGPASAIAAGVVARILDKHPDLKPPQLIEILRSTSQQAGTEKVMNLSAALNSLSNKQ